MYADLIENLVLENITKLVSYVLHKCDEADSFGDEIETEDVRKWLREYKP